MNSVKEVEIPGTTLLIDKDNQVDPDHILSHKQDSDIILVPQPSTDPNDPLNWSPTWKATHFTVLFFYTLINASAAHWTTTVYTLFTHEFDVEYSDLNRVTGIQNLVLAFSCLFAQPLANKYGRRPTYLLSTIMALVGCIVFASLKSYVGFIVFGVLIGLGVGPMDSLVGPSVNDIYFIHQHGKMMATYVLALALGSNFGIFVAGYIVAYTPSWTWCLYVLIILDGCVLLFAVVFLEESLFHRENVQVGGDFKLDNEEDAKPKSEELIKEVSIESSLSESNPRKSLWQRIISIVQIDHRNKADLFNLTISPLFTLRYPAVIFTSLVYGIQICWLQLVGVTLSQFYSPAPYNFSSESIGNMNLAGIIGAFAGVGYSILFNDRYQIWQTRRHGTISEPEYRLDLWFGPMVLNVLGVFLYGYGPAYGMHWVVGALGLGLINFGIATLSSLSLTYVMECYPKQASKTMVAVLFVRNIMSAIFTWVFQYWLTGIGVIWLVAMLGILCFVINGSVVIMIKWGKAFRIHTAGWYYNAVKD